MNRRLEGPAGGKCHQNHLGQRQAILQSLTLKGGGGGGRRRVAGFVMTSSGVGRATQCSHVCHSDILKGKGKVSKIKLVILMDYGL